MFPFNVRVYGVLVNENQQVLVCDELIRGNHYTKFPGGGLEYGEGTRDCLKREFMEEMSLKVEVTDHLYTTDFFQESAFFPGHQIISVYYYVKALEPVRVRLNSKPFEFDEQQLSNYDKYNEIESFRFIDWNDLSEDCLTLPIDKIVANLVKQDPNRQ